MINIKEINQRQINEILLKHKSFNSGSSGKRAIFTHAVFIGNDFRGAQLQGAIFQHCIFHSPDFTGADLLSASFIGCDLHHANFCGAFLHHTVFRKANLANAFFCRADLTDADIRGANLSGACLTDASLDFIKYDEYTSMYAPLCQEDVDLTGYARTKDYIVELHIPSDSKKVNGTTRMCRCSKATPYGILDLHGNFVKIEKVSHQYTFEVGRTIVVANFDEDRWNDTGNGINFFLTLDEAIHYNPKKRLWCKS